MSTLRRAIGLPSATALVVGTIIGSSIFVQASEITALVTSATAVVLAWATAGLPVGAGGDKPTDRERIDFVFHTLGRNEGNLDAARAYIAWEVGLVDQLDAQERGSFRL